MQWLRDVDRRRLYFADRATQLVTKEAHKARQQTKKLNIDYGGDNLAGGYRTDTSACISRVQVYYKAPFFTSKSIISKRHFFAAFDPFSLKP